jgi:hypothetical protein
MKKLRSILASEGLTRMASDVSRSDLGHFVDDWAMGKVKTLRDWTPETSWHPHALAAVRSFPEHQPKFWAEVVREMKKWRAKLKEERKLWSVYNKLNPRYRSTWKDHLEEIASGGDTPHSDDFLKVKWAAQAKAGQIAEWYDNFQSGGGRLDDPPSKWAR